MTPRETLVELLMQGMEKAQKQNIGAFLAGSLANILADYLIENKAIVPPCKVGDTVYDLVLCDDNKYRIYEMKVGNVALYGSPYNGDVWNMYLIDDFTYAYRSFYDIGRIVFLTKEEAIEALNRRADNGL